MNERCHGDFFEAGGIKLYCCMLNGDVVKRRHLINGNACPVCQRIIDGKEVGELPITTKRFVAIPERGQIELQPIDLPRRPR